MTESAKRVRPFSNGTEFDMWTAANCERCMRYGECEIDAALSEAFYGDGTIPADIAARMGKSLECAKLDVGASRLAIANTREALAAFGRDMHRTTYHHLPERWAHTRTHALISNGAAMVLAKAYVPDDDEVSTDEMRDRTIEASLAHTPDIEADVDEEALHNWIGHSKAGMLSVRGRERKVDRQLIRACIAALRHAGMSPIGLRLTWLDLDAPSGVGSALRIRGAAPTPLALVMQMAGDVPPVRLVLP